MHTRSQTHNLNRQQQAPPAVVEPFNLEEPFDNPPLVSMADNRTMAELLQAPTEGYEDAIIIPEINVNFELKHGLINLVQNKQFFGHDKEDPHAHIRSARIWLEKEPPRSILTWDDLVSKFINQFFPPSKMTNLRNEITRIQQRFDESFYEAWDRFNDLLRACPHHGFLELHQLDMFYNALNANDQDSLNANDLDSLNSAAGGNFLDKMPRECLKIIESKTKNMMKTMLIDKQKAQAPVPVKAVEQSCVTCGGSHSYRNCPATDGNVYRDNIQEYVSQAAAAKNVRFSSSNRLLTEGRLEDYYHPKRGLFIQGTYDSYLLLLQKFCGSKNRGDKGTVFPTNNGITEDVQPSVVPVENQNPVSEPVVAPVSAPMPNPKPSIPYPSRRNDEKRHENANEQIEKFYEIFKDMSFEISFIDALTLMPKFASILKALIGNKEKLSEMARTLVECNILPRRFHYLSVSGKSLVDPTDSLFHDKFP
ncbi:reverse transcriptase domain-containing protein [Tanacetum coccineum]